MSANVQVGLLTKPYDGLIVNSLEAYGLDKYLGRVIKKAFRKGTILGVGGNYHFGNNYVGLQAQYIHLRGGGITPGDALSVYFKKDFSGFDLIGLPVFVFDMQSNIFNLGTLYGHQFNMRNPNLFINAEAGLSKIIASKNTFSSNRPLIDQTAYAKNLYMELDQEMKKAYWKYGYIPTISLYLVYKLP